MTPPAGAAARAQRDDALTDGRASSVKNGAPRPVGAAEPEPAVQDDPAAETKASPPLWRNDRFEQDDWRYAAGDEAVGEGPTILTLERFLAERETLASRNAPLGVVVEPGEPIDDLAPHLSRVTLVALPFPKFADGRSMSAARLLRERHGFTGEVRATGDVLIDQMPLMRRCGFDSFEVANPLTRAQLEAGKWPDVPFYLQPVGSSAQSEIPAGARPWARRPG